MTAAGRTRASDAPAPPDTGLPPVTGCDVTATAPGAAVVKRLTRTEYNNTVLDLLGNDSRPADRFVPDDVGLGFDNNAEAQTLSPVVVEQYMDAAERVAKETDVSRIVPCAPTETDCARTFITSFGLKAWRRPLVEAEVTMLLGVFDVGQSSAGFTGGVRLVLNAMLQSPNFIYRPEPPAEQVAPGIARLDGYARATRLSYFLWRTTPDEVLLAAAAAGELDTAGGVALHAKRMLADPRAVQMQRDFHRQWLGLDGLDAVSKDPNMFPDFEALKPLMKEETLRFVEHVFREGDGKATTLFDAPFSVVTPELARFYGATPPLGTGFEKVDLDATQRRGILTHASVLSLHAAADDSSPIHRGVFVREHILCEPLPPPPNVDIVVPPKDPSLTTRERFAAHTTRAECSGCHTLIDGIGFGFEHYDADGSYRTQENGRAVDASGNVVGAGDAAGPFHSAVELAARFSSSETVQQCMLRQWFRYAYGRGERLADACQLQTLFQHFRGTGYDLRELVVALTQTENFLYRRDEATP